MFPSEVAVSSIGVQLRSRLAGEDDSNRVKLSPLTEAVWARDRSSSFSLLRLSTRASRSER
jgi:hypothetical protein